MNAIELLKDSHRTVAALFEEFESNSKELVSRRRPDFILGEEQAEYAKQAELAEVICKELIVHMMIEEELFYPAAREVLEDDDEVLIDGAIREHLLAKKLISNIRTLSTGIRLEMELKVLKRMIEHHVDEEEQELFPKLEKLGMELIDLGDKIETRKDELKGIL